LTSTYGHYRPILIARTPTDRDLGDRPGPPGSTRPCLRRGTRLAPTAAWRIWGGLTHRHARSATAPLPRRGAFMGFTGSSSEYSSATRPPGTHHPGVQTPTSHPLVIRVSVPASAPHRVPSRDPQESAPTTVARSWARNNACFARFRASTPADQPQPVVGSRSPASSPLPVGLDDHRRTPTSACLPP